MRRLARLSVLMLLLSLTGCASWLDSDFRDPEVHLIKVETVRARLMQQRFILHFRINNPNDSALQVRGLSYAVRLNELLLAQGDDGQWLRIDAHGRRTVQVEVRTNLWQHLKPLAKMLRAGTPLHYRLEGTLRTGLFFTRNLHLSRSGEIIPGDFVPE
ncbi:LEA type 2 family protein [Pseudomonas huaxiensis]|uniref:LEA type 2 family protein n=1 Tax=Pseudomonas huaxiensis TaxID=2213017 RepID=UPI000DA6ADC3|nr:LEA type 2 family protein [Pseudomonas huaxiensis]